MNDAPSETTDDRTDGNGTTSRVCPGCGTPNAAARMLCGRCGLDLESGDPQLTADPIPGVVATWPLAGVADDAPGIPWWVPVLAALLVVTGVVAAIVALGLGPFAPAEQLPSADFDEERLSGAMQPLALTDVATVTSREASEDRTFTPQHLVDGDSATAWHGDAEQLPPDTDETIDLFLQDPAWVGAVIVENGDQRDADAYAAAARVQRVTFVFDGGVRLPATLLDQGLQPQVVELDEPILSTTVRMEITEIVPGTETRDVAVTAMTLRGYPAQGPDVALAEERAEARPAAGVIVVPE